MKKQCFPGYLTFSRGALCWHLSQQTEFAIELLHVWAGAEMRDGPKALGGWNRQVDSV